MIDHAIGHARRSGVRRILLIGPRPRRCPRDVRVCRAPRGAALRTSLAIGLAALRPIDRDALILLADMPFAYVPQMRLTAGVDMVRPYVGGRPGHPVLVRAAAARAELRRQPGLGGLPRQRHIAGTAAHIFDVDTSADLRRARYARLREQRVRGRVWVRDISLDRTEAQRGRSREPHPFVSSVVETRYDSVGGRAASLDFARDERDWASYA